MQIFYFYVPCRYIIVSFLRFTNSGWAVQGNELSGWISEGGTRCIARYPAELRLGG